MQFSVPARAALPRNIVLPSLPEFRANAIAGMVAGVIALPLSIALAVAVGVPPIAGLYTAVFAGAFAAIFGGSKYNITGPTAALVPLLSHVVLKHGAGALPMVGLMAGVLLLAMSALKFGRLVRFMPGTVVVGFTAGIALSIIFGQANTFLAVSGTDPTLEHFHAKTWDTIRHLGSVGWVTPAVGLATLGILVTTPRAWPKVPPALIAIAAVTAFTWGFGVDT
ncbi:MAG TPA: SulP family inorganic anion transporter, partial [Tepidiformaceae bacterium]|nr:SulP family inorganic anion transporter [Tepidiformaceae bacterium]